MACGHHKNHQYEAGDWPVRCEFIALKKHGIPALIIFILLIVIYGNSFDCSWHLDDYSNIVKNENVHIASLSWTALGKSLYGIVDSGRWSRPVSYLSFALNYYFSGLDVFGYHLMNMTIHFLSTFILYLFILNTLMLPIFKGRYKGIANSVALLSAVLWMVNPIQVSAVTYVVQRMASMAALFYIISMYLYLKGRTSDRKWKAMILVMLSVLMGFLSIGTKENAAMLPVSIFLFDLILIQGFTIHNIKKNMMIAVPVFLAAVLTGFLFFKDFNSIIGDYSIRPFTVWERLITEPRVILFYIFLLLYPITSRLTLIHEFDISKSFFDPWTTILSMFVILAVLSLALVKARRWPLISYCVIFFFLNHAIEASFISLEIIYEHRNYLPSMLFFVPLSLFFVASLQRFEGRNALRIFLVVAMTSFIVLQGITVYIQNNIWKNGISLWVDNAEKAPRNNHVRLNLAIAYFNAGRLTDAFEEANKVLTSYTSVDNSKKARTDGLIAECYFLQGDYDKALLHYRESLKLNHQFHQGRHRIAQIMLRREQFPIIAEKNIRRALSLNSNVADYHLTYAKILLKKGLPDAAKQEVKTALLLDPDSAESYKVMACILKQHGQDRAAEHFGNVMKTEDHLNCKEYSIGNDSPRSTKYEWVRMTEKGDFAPRDGAGAVVFRNRMWLLGGWNMSDKKQFPMFTNNEVWNSKDGANWNLEKPNTFHDKRFNHEHDWEGRHSAGYVVYKGKMWIIGSDTINGNYQYDTWNSGDGKTWKLVNKDRPVPWGPRVLQYTVVFKNKIWIIGGQTLPQYASGKEAFYSDIWNTSDGINWKRVTQHGTLRPSRGMIVGSVVFKNRIWILGGGTYDTPASKRRMYYNDVWSSADGQNWTLHTKSASWAPRQYHSVAVFDGHMFVIAGYNESDRNDVWYSDDGVKWHELSHVPFKPRHATSVFVFDHSLWVVAGSNEESDVWRLQKIKKQKPGGND